MKENRGLFTLDAAQAYLAAEPEMTTEQLSPRLYSVTDGQVRTIFLEGDNTVIAFDTFGTPVEIINDVCGGKDQYERALRELEEQIYKQADAK